MVLKLLAVLQCSKYLQKSNNVIEKKAFLHQTNQITGKKWGLLY
jgi:hypothetical protein